MLRTHTCGALRKVNAGETVTLSGWVHRLRELGGMTFLDIRDRYGVTQVVFNLEDNPELCKKANALGREYVISISGLVRERSNKNPNLPTGDIELEAKELSVLNASKIPPFTIEEDTDGGEEQRMQYRYLDLRRAPLQKNLALRHRMALETRKYLDGQGFLEIETPFLIKSTPEGARDFVVPSRVHAGEFYALPQSPQTFKQILMVAGYDRYFQIVRCFRDEDLRADRQPEFTQIDCEMSFVEREDVLQTFEGMVKHLFAEIKEVRLPDFERITWEDAMERYGSDKPDLRFGMHIHNLNELARGNGFRIFDEAETVGAITAKNCSEYSRKQLDALTDWVRRPQIGAKGLVYVKCNEDGSFKSSVDKFYGEEDLKQWMMKCEAAPGDLLLIMSGERLPTFNALGALRVHMADELNLRKSNEFKPLWVLDFPLLEWDEETGRYYAMHHPFTSPLPDEQHFLQSDPGKVHANAYDLVINGVEIGGGSIRIHDRERQRKMFEILGFTDEEAQAQFGFLMNAFDYGAPPHGGIAFGFDRLCALFGGKESIRDFIAFPKNNAGKDVMIDAPDTINPVQLKELHLNIVAEDRDDQ